MYVYIYTCVCVCLSVYWSELDELDHVTPMIIIITITIAIAITITITITITVTITITITIVIIVIVVIITFIVTIIMIIIIIYIYIYYILYVCIYIYMIVTKVAHPDSMVPLPFPGVPSRHRLQCINPESPGLWETWKLWKQLETSSFLQNKGKTYPMKSQSDRNLKDPPSPLISLHGAQPTMWQGRLRRKRCRLSGTAKGRPVTRHDASSPMAGPNLKPSPAKPQTSDLQIKNCLSLGMKMGWKKSVHALYKSYYICI